MTVSKVSKIKFHEFYFVKCPLLITLSKFQTHSSNSGSNSAKLCCSCPLLNYGGGPTSQSETNQKKVALKPRKLASKGLGDLFSDRVLFTTKRTSSWPVKSSLIPLLELTRHALSQQTTYYYLQQRFGLLLSLTKCFCLTTTKIGMIMLTVHATSLAKTESFDFEDTQ